MPKRLKEFSDFKTVNDLIINNYREFGNKTAFIQQISKATETEKSVYRKWTYSEFYEDWKYLCRIFRKFGIQKGDRVALIGSNAYVFALAFLSLASGIGVPAILPNVFDKETVANCCAEINAKFAVYDRSKKDLVPEGIPSICTGDFLQLIAEEKKAYPNIDPTEVSIDENNDEAIILFKSSLKPGNMAVVATNRQIYENISLIRNEIHISHTDRFISLSHMCFYYEIYCGLFFPMSRGASVIYSIQINDSAAILASAIREEKPTITVISPNIISRFYTMIWDKIVADGNVENAKAYIKRVSSAGSIRRGIKQNTMDELHRLFGESLDFIISSGNVLSSRIDNGMRAFGTPIINVYGMAECPIVALKSPFAPGSGEKSYVSTEIGIKAVPVPGEGFGKLMIKGTRVSKHYASGEEVGEWLDTGDYGTVDENRTLTIAGKDYNAYVSEYNGHLICPEQIERVIANQFGIDEAYVYPEKLSDGRTVLAAKICPEPALSRYRGKEYADELARKTVSNVNSILLPYKKIRNAEIVSDLLKRDHANRFPRISPECTSNISVPKEDEVFSYEASEPKNQ